MNPCEMGSMTRQRDRNEADIDPEEVKVLHAFPRILVRKRRWAMHADEKQFIVEQGHVTALRIIRMNNNFDGVGALKHLRYLELRSCGLSEVPVWVRDLPDLEYLTLRGNPISSVPVWLALHPKLRVLDLRGTKLPEQPEIDQRWRMLENIWDLFSNTFRDGDHRMYAEDEYAFAVQCFPYTIGPIELRHFYPPKRPRYIFLDPPREPMSIEKLIAILLKRKFDILEDNIKRSFNFRGKMTELVVKDTPIGNLPAWTAPFKKLKTIRLIRCGLTTFPEVITSFPELAIINLTDNQISQIPQEVTNLSRLKLLVTVGNPIANTLTLPPKLMRDDAGKLRKTCLAV